MRYALPQSVTRHAVDEDAFAVVNSAPVRRGIAVVAVVGGALSAGTVGASALQQPQPQPDTDAAIGLTAHSEKADKDDDEKSDEKADNKADKNADRSDDDPVLDGDAVKKAVKKASEEGRRLAEKDKDKADRDEKARDDGDDDGSASAAAEATAAAESGPAARPGSASMPGQLIDTHDWYLTLPTGKEGSPDTIDGSKLATYHSKFFDLNQQRNGIVFNASASGVTTKNSHYPRSELREMDGSQKAAWSNTSGTHVFDVREAFTKLPGSKPEVVGVQIHDGEDDVMQVRLEGQKLMVQYHDGKSEAMLDPNYRLGTPFDVRVVAAGGKVDVLYNGQKKAELPLAGSGWYWKVGAYVQSNGSKGDGASSAGEVVVYKADVKHS